MIDLDHEQSKALSESLRRWADELRAGYVADIAKIERETREIGQELGKDECPMCMAIAAYALADKLRQAGTDAAASPLPIPAPRTSGK